MKPGEAIKAIKSNYPSENYTTLCEALDLAIQVLEKQIAKKPVNYGHCPECFSDNDCPYNEEKVRCCPSCGQKLDWSDEE